MPSDTILVGLCTGLVAAAAVSASRSLLDLVTNAPSIVRVAFRVGVKVNGTAQRLSTKYGAEVNQSWSRLVVGVQKEASIAEVKQFNEKKVSKLACRINALSMELIDLLRAYQGPAVPT